MKTVILIFLLLVIPNVLADTYVTSGSRIEQLDYREAFLFEITEQRHNIVVLKVTNDSVRIRISPQRLDLTFKERESRDLDINGNGLADFNVNLIKVSRLGGFFIFTILDEAGPLKINETINITYESINITSNFTIILPRNITNTTKEVIVNDTDEPEVIDEVDFIPERDSNLVWLILLALLIAVGALLYINRKKD